MEFYAAIYQPDDFCEKAYKYCNQQYGDKGIERGAFEICMTPFYGEICTAALWKETDSTYENGSA